MTRIVPVPLYCQSYHIVRSRSEQRPKNEFYPGDESVTEYEGTKINARIITNGSNDRPSYVDP